jgi:hypothetical protein
MRVSLVAKYVAGEIDVPAISTKAVSKEDSDSISVSNECTRSAFFATMTGGMRILSLLCRRMGNTS